MYPAGGRWARGARAESGFALGPVTGGWRDQVPWGVHYDLALTGQTKLELFTEELRQLLAESR